MKNMLKREVKFYERKDQQQQAIIKEWAITDNDNIQLNRCSTENSKLKPSKRNRLLIFSLLPVTSCPNCSDCKDKCYALPSIKMYKNTRIKWAQNWHLAKFEPALLEDLINFQIHNELKLAEKQNKGLVFRIHESGDFFSSEYVELWIRIIKEHPTVKFYGYSKSWGYVEGLEELAELNNMNLINSYIDEHLNFGDQDHIKHLVNNHEAFKCKGSASGDGIKCVKDCIYCVTGQKPAFIAH